VGQLRRASVSDWCPQWHAHTVLTELATAGFEG
jgi:hypothetical protein